MDERVFLVSEANVITVTEEKEGISKADEEKIAQVSAFLDSLIEDSSVPRNVRSKISEARDKLKDLSDLSVAVSGAVYSLDEVSNDINLPMHARTRIWNLLSELESIKSHLGKGD